MNKKELFRTIKYTAIAASAGVIQIGTFTLFNELLQWNYWLSYLVSLVLSVVWNFTINRRYTFKSADNIWRPLLMLLGYYVVFTPASTLLEHWLTTGLGWNEYVVTVINMLLNFSTEFLFQRFVIYRKTIDTNQLAQKNDSTALDESTASDESTALEKK